MRAEKPVNKFHTIQGLESFQKPILNDSQKTILITILKK